VNLLIVTLAMRALALTDPWLPTVPLPLDGPALAFFACFADILLLGIAHWIHWLVARPIRLQIAQAKRELAAVDMKEEFPKYARLQRSINSYYAQLRARRMPAVFWALRSLLPAILLRRGVVCEFPAHFWWPVARLVGSDGGQVKVGFALFWGAMLAPADARLFEWVDGVIGGRGHITSL
jgi:hypothetical protein